jgi:peptidoglycan/xylan/chitin deacetylase (PgdA/CDA1 family)
VYFNNLEYLLSIIYPKLTWTRKCSEKLIYLSFDDGPIPEVTAYVLEELDRFNARATFFCVGDNVSKYPEVFKKIIEKGHKVGNHTFNHLNGWKNDTSFYLDNVAKSDAVMLEHISADKGAYFSTTNKKLFRPPYGKIKKSQIRALADQYEIVMWDVLTGDFDKSLSPEKCLHKAIKYTSKGSIVIFHDSLKALPNLQYALPRFLKHFTEAGYRFETL